jgi:glycosyltransferase involved in cell wall biosynthesis
VQISLITGTAGRTDELSRLGLSLTQQTTKKFEWIVVDQNSDARINAILDTFRTKNEIKHLRSEPNLSNALNLGVQTARAKIVGFPDDDG